MRPGPLAGLLFVLLLAAAARLPGLGNGLPQVPDPDSFFVVQAVRFESTDEFEKGQGTDTNKFDLYPHFLGRLTAALPGRLDPLAPDAAPVDEHLAAAAHADLTGRRVSALLSLLVVPATYLLARPYLAPGWSILAALLAGTSLLGTLLAHQARPHAPLFAFVACTLAGAQRLARDPAPGNIALTSVGLGLALATLHSGAALALPVGVACLFALQRRGWGALPRLVLVAAGPALAIVYSYPFLFGDDLWAGRAWPGNAFDGTGFAKIAGTLWAFEPTLVVLGIVAIAPRFLLPRAPRAAGHDARAEGWVLAAFAVPYAVAIGLYYMTWHRFSLPLVPVLAVVGAIGARRLAFAAARVVPAPSGLILGAVGILAALFPAATALRFSWLWSRPHVTTEAARWVEANLDPAEARLMMCYGFSLPLPQTGESARRTAKTVRTPWHRYLVRLDDAGAAPLGPAWTIDSTWSRPAARRVDPTRLAEADMRRRMRAFRSTHAVVHVPGPNDIRGEYDETHAAVHALDGRLLARFVPYRSEEMSGTLGTEDQFGFEAVALTWGARCLGPVLEIYELPDGRKGQRR